MSHFNLRRIYFKDAKEAEAFLRDEIQCHGYGAVHMGTKLGDFNILVENLRDPACNILKQAMLSIGGEVAVHHDTIVGKGGHTSALIMGSQAQLQTLIKKIKPQDFGMKQLSLELTELLHGPKLRSERNIVYDGGELKFGKRTLIMGILNCTPDSFSDGGKWFDSNKAIDRALAMEAEGADVIDIGGESTRPGSAEVSLEEEWERVLPVIEGLKGKLSIPISIDSYKAATAEAALKAGASIINDVWGLQRDPEMVKIAAKYQCPTIVMHNKTEAIYDNFMGEILGFLRKSIELGMEAGCKKEQFIVDPGFGFGKNIDHNLFITKYLSEMQVLGCPVLMAASRKKTIGLVLDKDVEHRILGDAAVTAVSIANGADMIRVHDVKEMAEVAKMTDAIMKVAY